MTEFDVLLGSLDEMPIHQLEQFNRLMEAVRRHLPRENLTKSQEERRARAIRRAVARLRAGVTDAELDVLILELKAN